MAHLENIIAESLNIYETEVSGNDALVKENVDLNIWEDASE